LVFMPTKFPGGKSFRSFFTPTKILQTVESFHDFFSFFNQFFSLQTFPEEKVFNRFHSHTIFKIENFPKSARQTHSGSSHPTCCVPWRTRKYTQRIECITRPTQNETDHRERTNNEVNALFISTSYAQVCAMPPGGALRPFLLFLYMCASTSFVIVHALHSLSADQSSDWERRTSTCFEWRQRASTFRCLLLICQHPARKTSLRPLKLRA